MTASSVLITVFLDYFFSNPTVYQNTKKWVFYTALVLDISVISLMGFSRLYNGVHTLDQIILGTMLGTWLAFVMHLCVREMLFKNVEYLLFNPTLVTKHDFLLYIGISTGSIVIILLTVITTF
jgi:membrane-associated phospholipid phosphatase